MDERKKDGIEAGQLPGAEPEPIHDEFVAKGMASGGYTRRRFLSDIGKAGGAAMMYSTMEAMGFFRGAKEARASDTFVPITRGGRTAKVVILGGGIGGLTAAYELLKGGYDVTILEARQRPGGRNWTARRGTKEAEIGGPLQQCFFSTGQYMNMGPARLPQDHITIDYCRELGVPLEVFTNQNANAYYFNENTSTVNYGPWASTPIQHRTAKADYYGYTSELLAKAVNQNALDAELTATDKELLIAFLRSFGALTGTSNLYTGGSRRGYENLPGAGDDPGVPLGPVPAVSDVLASRLGLYFSFEFGFTQAMLMFQPVGGMDRIPYAFERAIVRGLGGKIVYGAETTEVLNTPTGVQVAYTDFRGTVRTMTADYCVCNIPPQVLKNIPNNFSPEVQSALNVPTIQSTGKIGFEYKRRFWEEDEKILGGITNTNMDLSTIWYPSYGYGTKRGVVVGYYNFGGNAISYGNLSPAEREARAIAQGEKIHGAPYRDELASSYSVAWQRVKYSEGGWVNWPTSGGVRNPAYLLLNQPAGNVYFCGDHLSYEIAWQAGAIYSARKVVSELVARVNA